MPDLLLKRSDDSSAWRKAGLLPLRFEDLDGFDHADLQPAWRAFLRSCASMVERKAELRPGLAPSEAMVEIGRRALGESEDLNSDQIRAFLQRTFEPFLIVPAATGDQAGSFAPGIESTFFTAYYRPEVPASREPTDEYREAILARPKDLVSFHGETPDELPPGFTAGRRGENGGLEVCPSRKQIDEGALDGTARPLAYVSDAIEAFMIQVQGSAKLVFGDGTAAELTYAGRNGHPYVSIGKALIEAGEISTTDMSLDRLKAWVRANGQELGERGRELLHRNPSFVFFSMTPTTCETDGPIGAAGLPLSAHASLAVDRTQWPYGLPFWIETEIAWRDTPVEPFRRLMIAQDTGSAIVGPARADLYFGSGERAGRLAGGVRHGGRMIVLLPRSRS